MPVDYNIPSPLPAVAQGMQIGSAINAAEAAKANQQILNQDVNALITKPNPTAADYAAFTMKHPSLHDQTKQAFGMLNAEQQQNKISHMSDVYSATATGHPEVAVKLLQDQAQAARNSGNEQDAKHAETMASLIQTSPRTAMTAIGTSLAALMGPDKFAETYAKLGTEQRAAEMAPSKLTEAQAKAQKAAIDSKFAESNAVVDLQKKGWDIYKLQEDTKIAKENSRIAALNAQLAREQNEMKKQELGIKLKDMQDKRDQAVRDKAAMIDQSRTTIDNSLTTIDRLLKNPALADVTGAIEGGKYYPTTLAAVASPFGTSADDRANAIADFETIKAQAFITQLQNLKNAAKSGASGLGSLSEAEGERLINSLQSLSRKQGTARVEENLRIVQKLLMKARTAMAKKLGVPDTIPQTPQVKTSPQDIDALVRHYLNGPGAAGTPMQSGATPPAATAAPQ